MNLSEIIQRLEKIDERRQIPGTDSQVVATHLIDLSNQLYRFAMRVKRGET